MCYRLAPLETSDSRGPHYDNVTLVANWRELTEGAGNLIRSRQGRIVADNRLLSCSDTPLGSLFSCTSNALALSRKTDRSNGMGRAEPRVSSTAQNRHLFWN
jgi:photosystem II stability/assembly factor-like uncharacterized protein